MSVERGIAGMKDAHQQDGEPGWRVARELSPAEASYRRLRWIVVGGSLVFLLLLGASLGAFLWLGRQELAARTAHHAEALTRAMEEHTSRTIESADSLIAVAALGLAQDWRSGGSPRWPGGVQKQTEEIPQLRALRVVDASGKVVLDTENVEIGEDRSERDYFTTLRNDPTLERFLSDPLYGRSSDHWFLPLARPIVDGDGQFLGVVVGILEPTYFDAFYRAMGLGEHNTIAVVKTNGIVITRYPYPERYVGRLFPEPPISPVGVNPEPVTMDGIPRIVAHRVVSGLPLVVMVGLTEDFTFSGWRRQANAVSTGFAVSALAVAVLTLLILRQISRLARSETALRQRGRELETSNLELEQFAYIASHDLQEPLRMVTSYLQLVERRSGDKLDVEAQQFIGYAIDGARRMQGLIRDLLQLSRVGRRHPMEDSVSLREVVERATRSLGPAIDEAKAEIIASELPVVIGAETELLSLFQNLLGNAVKYREPSRDCRIGITAQRGSGEWLIMVEDNGIGIDPEFHERIFLPFQRLHPVGRFEGTGIGLAIVRKVVERHGGRVWVEAGPSGPEGMPVGSRFCFTFPDRSESRAA